MGGNGQKLWQNLNQERIVLLVTVLIFAAASLTLSGFLTAANLIAIVRSIAVLGILALGMRRSSSAAASTCRWSR